MASNPFTITFGKTPGNYISRDIISNEIIECFSSYTPFTQTYILTGLRGMGKTVTMSSVANHFKNQTDWIVIDLNPSRDLLDSLGAKLYRAIRSSSYEIDEINPSAFGFSLGSIRKKEDPLFDIELLIDELLEEVRKKQKKVLITIDEVSNTAQIKSFALSFQGMLRNDYPVFLLMTGLYQNIADVQNDKILTFLYRAKKINLETLNLSLIKNSYRDIFHLSNDKAHEMAALTNGYPFAYQVLGYLVWTNPDKSLSELMNQYDSYLSSNVYEKLWQESSGQDKDFLIAMSKVPGKTKKASDIMNHSKMSTKTYSVYRDRLLKKGLITSVKYGEIRFTLPRFTEFIESKLEFE